MKIAIFPSWYPNKVFPYYGVFVERQAEALASAGCEVAVVYLNFGASKRHLQVGKPYQTIRAKKNGISIYRKAGVFIPKRYDWILEIWLYFYERLFLVYMGEQGKPDVIHAHNYLAGYAARHISQKYNIPYLITEHSSKLIRHKVRPIYQRISRQVYEDSALIIAVSEVLAGVIRQQTNTTVKVLGNTVNISVFRLGDKPNKAPFICIAVGSLIPMKNYTFMIKSFAQFVERSAAHSEAKLWIVGMGPKYTELMALVQSLGLEKQVVFLGEKKQKEVAHLLQQAHLFLHTSWMETFGIVLLEAMASGLPVLTLERCDPANLVTQDVGRKMKQENEAEFALTITQIIATYDQYDKKAIRKKVVEEYSDDRLIVQLLSLYKALS